MINYQHLVNSESPPDTLEIINGDVAIDEICAWLIQQRPLIDKILNTKGAILIKGFVNLKTAADFEKAITSISPNLRDYVGGTSPREKVRGNIMTATYVPPSWSIPLHQEMAYTKNPPDRIAFFCLASAPFGGDSTIGDMRQFTAKIAPSIMNKFKMHGLQLRRTLVSETALAKKPGVKKTWSEVFGTSDAAKVDEISKEKGWRSEWLDEDILHLWQEILPATKIHPMNKTEVWFNQSHFFSPICMMDWAKHDGRVDDYEELAEARIHHPEMLDNIFYGNGEVVADEEALYIANLLKESEINVKLAPSDLLILDNTLTAHGRTAFSGNREILVALLNQ